jgi:uncharacterized protein YdeI (YjbR/CyaY-like superfamily)
MVKTTISRMKRPIYPMPDDVKEALKGKELMRAYRDRPMYQQNDYIGWIGRAKLPATRLKRLEQMLAELKAGDKYMKMEYNPKRKML